MAVATSDTLVTETCFLDLFDFVAKLNKFEIFEINPLRPFLHFLLMPALCALSIHLIFLEEPAETYPKIKYILGGWVIAG